MLCEKASLEEHVARLDREAKRLTDHLGALTLENIGLSEQTAELEVDLVGESVARVCWRRKLCGSFVMGYVRLLTR